MSEPRRSNLENPFLVVNDIWHAEKIMFLKFELAIRSGFRDRQAIQAYYELCNHTNPENYNRNYNYLLTQYHADNVTALEASLNLGSMDAKQFNGLMALMDSELKNQPTQYQPPQQPPQQSQQPPKPSAVSAASSAVSAASPLQKPTPRPQFQPQRPQKSRHADGQPQQWWDSKLNFENPFLSINPRMGERPMFEKFKIAIQSGNFIDQKAIQYYCDLCLNKDVLDEKKNYLLSKYYPPNSEGVLDTSITIAFLAQKQVNELIDMIIKKKLDAEIKSPPEHPKAHQHQQPPSAPPQTQPRQPRPQAEMSETEKVRAPQFKDFFRELENIGAGLDKKKDYKLDGYIQTLGHHLKQYVRGEIEPSVLKDLLLSFKKKLQPKSFFQFSKPTPLENWIQDLGKSLKEQPAQSNMRRKS